MAPSTAIHPGHKGRSPQRHNSANSAPTCHWDLGPVWDAVCQSVTVCVIWVGLKTASHLDNISIKRKGEERGHQVQITLEVRRSTTSSLPMGLQEEGSGWVPPDPDPEADSAVDWVSDNAIVDLSLTATQFRNLQCLKSVLPRRNLMINFIAHEC